MTLLRYLGRRFVTTILVGSHKYQRWCTRDHDIKIFFWPTCFVSSISNCNGAVITVAIRCICEVAMDSRLGRHNYRSIQLPHPMKDSQLYRQYLLYCMNVIYVQHYRWLGYASMIGVVSVTISIDDSGKMCSGIHITINLLQSRWDNLIIQQTPHTYSTMLVGRIYVTNMYLRE